MRTSFRAEVIKTTSNFLPSRRGQFVYWSTKLLASKKRFIGRFHGGLLEVNPLDPACKSAYYFGFYERETTRWFLRQVRGKKITFLDVGANFGYFSLLASRYAHKDSQLIAFEPDPHTRGWLERNKRLNRHTLKIENFAVSDKSGEVEFLSCSEDEYNSSWSRITLSDAPAPEHAQKIKVRTISLDSYLEEHRISEVDIVKIDVEGAEGLALRGMQKGLKKKIYKTLFVEFHDWALPKEESTKDLVKYVMDFGYKAYRLKTSHLTKERDRDPATYKLDGEEDLVEVTDPLSLLDLKDWEHFVFTSP